MRMLAYNGSIPGPTLHVNQGSEITVHVSNDGEVDTTRHRAARSDQRGAVSAVCVEGLMQA